MLNTPAPHTAPTMIILLLLEMLSHAPTMYALMLSLTRRQLSWSSTSKRKEFIFLKLLDTHNSLRASLTDEVGFIAIDNTRKDIILSYRGSSSIRNFVDDILFSKTDCDFGDGCEAHAGFMAAFESTSDVVLPAIQDAVANYTGYTLIVTGHSLGGAVATIAAATIRDSGITAALVCLPDAS